MSRAGLSDSHRHFIAEHGGVITETTEGYAVSFPDESPIQPAQASRPSCDQEIAGQIEAAVERAKEYGTTFVPLWRERGEGWYAATSHEEHPGFWYLLQIDERTGWPVRCECEATVVCHHLGAVITAWRDRVAYDITGDQVLHEWEATLALVQQRRPKERQEEEW